MCILNIKCIQMNVDNENGNFKEYKATGKRVPQIFRHVINSVEINIICIVCDMHIGFVDECWTRSTPNQFLFVSRQ